MKHPRQSQTSDSATGGMTTAPIVAQAATIVPALPEFIRLPRIGERCPWTGLSRAVMWQLIERGSVRSISLRKPGARKGTRLIVLESLLGHLRSLAASEKGGEA